MDYVADNKEFTFLDQDNVILSCIFPFCDKNKNGDIHTIENYSNMCCRLLHKHKVPENEIIQAFVKKKNEYGKLKNTRIGWLIPISALISVEHDYFDDIHFGYYAFYCYIYLLNNPIVLSLLKEGRDFFEILNELYIEPSTIADKDSVLFVCERDNIPTNMTIDSYEVSLYQFGYYKKWKETNPKCRKIDKKIILEATSNVFICEGRYLDEYIESYVNELFFEDNQKIRFFLLYQLVEIVIDDIMINQLNKQLSDYKKGVVSTRGLDTLVKVNTELQRIKKMIEISHISEEKYRDIHSICDKYLQNKGHESVGFPESLYHFRNMLVHRFRWVLKDELTIKDVNDLLEILMFDILINYHTNE